jgi:hypothetical protein
MKKGITRQLILYFILVIISFAIVIGFVFGFMFMASSVNDFITDVKKIGFKQETIQTDMVYEDTITQQYVHTNIEVDSTKFDYEIDDSKKE